MIKKNRIELDKTNKQNILLTQLNGGLKKENMDLETQLVKKRKQRKLEETRWKMGMDQATVSLHHRAQEIFFIRDTKWTADEN